MEWLLRNEAPSPNVFPRFWARDGDDIELLGEYEPDNIDYQFHLVPTSDGISDIFGQERCSFKILARKNRNLDTYFDYAVDPVTIDEVTATSDDYEGENFYINFKGFLFQGEYFDGESIYAGLPAELLQTGNPVVTFDIHNNTA